MTDTAQRSTTKADLLHYSKGNIRDYALLLSLLAITIFVHLFTNGTLF